MTDTTVSTTEAPVIADAPTTDTDHPSSSSSTTKMMIDSNNGSTSTTIITNNNNNGDNETAVNESAVGDLTNNNTNKRTHSQMMQHSSESHDDHDDDSKSHETTTTTHQNKSAKMKHNEEEEEDDEMTIDDGEEESSSSTLTSVSSRNHQNSNNTTITTTTPTNTTPAVPTTSHPSSSTSSPTITSTSNDTTNLSTTQNDSEKQQEQQHESSTTKPTMISHQNDQQQQPIASTPSLSTTTPTEASTTTTAVPSSSLTTTTTTTASSADAPTTTSSATTVPASDSSAMTDTVDPSSSVSNIDTVQQQKRFPSSINYTVLTPEKMIENPIILRGCDASTMWDMKELVQLRENLKQMYEKSKRIIRIYKKDLRKIDFEIESKHFLPKSKRRRDSDNASDPTSNHNANGTSPEKQIGRTTIHSIDDWSGGDSCDDEDEFFAQAKKVRLCGYVDAKGHTCKRKGFCPFHHKSYVDQQSSDISRRQNYYYRPMSRYEFFHDSAYDVNRTMLAANKKEKLASLKVSTLLVAAAALERNSIEEQPERKVQEQTAQVDAQQYEGDAQHVVQPLSSHDTYTNQPLSSAYQQQPHYGPTDTNVSQQTAVNGSAAVSGNQQQSAYTSHQQQPAFQAHSRSQQQQPMYEQPKSSYYEHNGSHNLPWINSSNPPERSAYQSSHAPVHHYAHQQQQQQPAQHNHHHHQPVPPASMSSQNRRTHEESYGLPHTFYPSESSHSAPAAAPPASAPLSAFHSALHPMQDMPAMSNSYQSSTNAPAADSSGNRPFNLPSLLSFAPSQPSSSAGRGLPSFLSGPPSSSPGHIPSLKELGSVPLGNLPFGLPPPIASSNQNQETQARPTQQQGAWDMSHARYHE